MATTKRKHRYISVPVETEVDVDIDDIIQDYSPAELGFTIESVLAGSDVAARIQQVFYNHGPENERLCRWWLCMEQPWKGIAEALGLVGP